MESKDDDDLPLTFEELRRRKQIDAEVATSDEPELYQGLLAAVEELLARYGELDLAVSLERLVREFKAEVQVDGGRHLNQDITDQVDYAWEQGWLRGFDASGSEHPWFVTVYTPGWWSQERVERELPDQLVKNEEKPKRH